MSQLAVKIQDLCEESNGFEKLRKGLSRDLIDQACAEADLPDRRNRRLPSGVVVWLLVGMAIFRKESIQAVALLFNIGLGVAPTSSSLSEARNRLGPNVLRWLFQRLAALWHEEMPVEKVRGFTVYGIDGSVLTLEDTKKNVAYFGKPGSRKDKMGAARPQARTIGLMELSTKLLVDGEIVPLTKGENTAVQPLIERIPANSLTVVDRGFQSRKTFFKIHEDKCNRHFLARVKKTFNPEWVRNSGTYSWIGRICFSASERKEDPSLPEDMLVRVIEYQIHGHKDAIRVVTSLLEEKHFPAGEIARLYHLRWEYELGLRDLKVTLLQSKDALRSKKPEGVLQEIWAIFLAYNLVRHEVGIIAKKHGVNARSLSFKMALSAVDRFFTIFSSGYADLSSVPEAIEGMRLAIWRERLRERDPERICPRWVKDKQPSKFPKKPSSASGV